jgi:hypothetical protein
MYPSPHPIHAKERHAVIILHHPPSPIPKWYRGAVPQPIERKLASPRQRVGKTVEDHARQNKTRVYTTPKGENMVGEHIRENATQ